MNLFEGEKFGFGCMRMPLTDPSDNTSFDYGKIEQLFNDYLAKGFSYSDTAYAYHGHHAEEAVRHAHHGKLLQSAGVLQQHRPDPR